MFLEAKPRGTVIEVEGKQNSLFPRGGAVIKCFVIPPDSKIEKKYCEKMICLTRTKALLILRAAVKPSCTTRTRHDNSA